MDATTITETLTRYIIDELLEGEGADLDEHTPLLELGIIDSMSMVSLLGYIQSELGVEVPESEVSPRNFMSIATLRDMILRVQVDAS